MGSAALILNNVIEISQDDFTDGILRPVVFGYNTKWRKKSHKNTSWKKK